MADPTTTPIPALAEQPIPEGFNRFILPDGRKVFLSKKLTSEQIDTAMQGLVDLPAYRQQITSPIASTPAAQALAQTYQERIAQPATESVSKLLAAPGQALLQGANALTNIVGPRGMPPGMARQDSPEAQAGGLVMAQRAARPIAEAVVPQTLSQAGAMAGASLVPGGPLARIGAGAVGGEIGNQLEGGTHGAGALIGGVAGLAGEAAGKGVEITRRAMANLTGSLYKADAKAIGQALGEVAPSLKGASTTQELRDLVYTGEGKKRLFESLQEAYQATRDRIQLIGGGPHGTGGLTTLPDLNVPSLGGRVSWDTALKALTSRFRTGFKTGGATEAPGTLPTDAARQARVDFHNILAEVKTDLNRLDPTGVARDIFESGRQEFRQGVTALDMVYRAKPFEGRGNEVDLLTNRLQAYVNQNEAKLRRSMGDRAFERLSQDIFRGAQPGAMDSPGLALGSLRGIQRGPGGMAVERLPSLSAPNYAGKPLATPQELQRIIDAMAERYQEPVSMGAGYLPLKLGEVLTRNRYR